ncbi:PREDICTED: glutamic acid-rich protein-like [Nicrophorus vespilloides]|uniref:Glutamic acid-rich protein-like n=1 Tax=Nicrophorus vespilloides TaxID=110193 RepID=A0ABM1NE82_NICVS|nr:PREDICTED: glutamic acid-rich protein-like [Nicrophorus vespilloides]
MPPGKKPIGSEPKSNTIKGYKPPWIKEAAEANKETETPWGIMKKRDIIDPEDAKRRNSKRTEESDDEEDDESTSFAIPQLRKVSVTKVEPKVQENGEEKIFHRPQLKSVRQKEPKPVVKDNSKIAIPKLNSVKVEKMKELPPPPKKETPDYRQVLKKTPTRDRLDDEKKRGSISIPMAPPMAPPMPPPAPAMPKAPNVDPLSQHQKAKLDSLRSRPKTRPDWTAVLKGIETGRKLKHVECNDRSKPLLTAVKTKGQYLYESEKDNAHNVLLKAIQQGVKLNSVKTNDRSKPNLEGLRKFRRQMTIEEQIQKSVSMASIPPVHDNSYSSISKMEEAAAVAAEEVDEMDDIDKVRDDLQSTKQLLAIEMRNKEALARENKRLLTKMQNIEKDKNLDIDIAKAEKEHDKKREPDEKLIITLKAEVAEARKKSEDLEKKYTQTVTQLDNTKFELEEMKRRNSELEKKLQEILCGKKLSISDRRDSQAPRGEDDFDNNLSISDTDSDEEETDEKRQKRLTREVKMLSNKLRNFKNKVDNAKKERLALKEIMKKHQSSIKEEKKRYKQLQKEVDKMAAYMRESESEDDEDEDEEDEKEESETDSSESDTESSESEDSESEKSQSEPEDSPPEKKKENLIGRTRRHENRLAALKKTNFMLKTSAERLQDDLNIQKEMTHSLQEDLDSVLAELG